MICPLDGPGLTGCAPRYAQIAANEATEKERLAQDLAALNSQRTAFNEGAADLSASSSLFMVLIALIALIALPVNVFVMCLD